MISWKLLLSSLVKCAVKLSSECLLAIEEALEDLVEELDL